MIQTKIEEMVDSVELQLNHQTLGQNFTIEIGEQGSKGGGSFVPHESKLQSLHFLPDQFTSRLESVCQTLRLGLHLS